MRYFMNCSAWLLYFCSRATHDLACFECVRVKALEVRTTDGVFP